MNYSPLRQHAIKNNHVLDWDTAQVIDSCQRFYLVSWNFRNKMSSKNRDERLQPSVYNYLILRNNYLKIDLS